MALLMIIWTKDLEQGSTCRKKLEGSGGRRSGRINIDAFCDWIEPASWHTPKATKQLYNKQPNGKPRKLPRATS